MQSAPEKRPHPEHMPWAEAFGLGAPAACCSCLYRLPRRDWWRSVFLGQCWNNNGNENNADI